MKKLIALTVCAALAFSLCACAQNNEVVDDTPTNTPQNAQIPNPVVGVQSAADFEALGIKMDAPEGASDVNYAIISNEIAEVRYTLNDVEYTYRASKSSEDISGVYDTFTDAFTRQVALKDAEIEVAVTDAAAGGRLAQWEKDGVKYSLWNSGNVDDDTLMEVINALMPLSFEMAEKETENTVEGVSFSDENTECEADIDGDGTMEKISLVEVPEQDYNLAQRKVIVTFADGTSCDITLGIAFSAEGLVVDLDGDGKLEILVWGDCCSCDFETWALRVENGAIVPAQRAYEPDDPADETIFCSAVGAVERVEDGTIIISDSVDIIGTWWCETQFKLASDSFRLERVRGSVWTNAADYSGTNEDFYSLKTVKELPVKLDGGSGDVTMLETGTELRLMDTDEATYFRFVTHDGRTGIIEVVDSRDSDAEFWGWLIDGAPEGDYFETIPYAG